MPLCPGDVGLILRIAIFYTPMNSNGSPSIVTIAFLLESFLPGKANSTALAISIFVASFNTSKVYCPFSVAATDFSVINDFLITSYNFSVFFVSLLIIVTSQLFHLLQIQSLQQNQLPINLLHSN